MVVAYLALAILALEVVSAVLDAIGYGAVAAAAWGTYSRGTGNRKAAERLRLRDAIVELRRDLQAVSSVDEFSRWAKMRRRLDSLSADFERVSSDLAVERTAFELYVNMGLRAAVYGVRAVVNVYNYRVAVFYVPANWFYPVLWFLSLPAAPMGSVSVTVWAFACNRICKRVAGAFGRPVHMQQPVSVPVPAAA
ncbi:GET complex subunit get1 [Coemansia javaensis]|uniref:GET complex subunit get1 n=1 Tax=Coemansia javaensis TaxID=2761396 RepID=A0A9W8HM99_9FUNG|nr:GET complex subunit get1 [Coemansia javaensis]